MNGTLRNHPIKFVRGYITSIENEAGIKLFKAFAPYKEYVCKLIAKTSTGYHLKFNEGWVYNVSSHLVNLNDNSNEPQS